MPNLAPELPADALNEWNDGPPAYTTEDISATYSARTGNITTGIENASANGNVAYASTGNYEFTTTVNSAGSNVIGIEGDGSGSTVLYYTGTNLDYFVNLITSATLILRGFTIDITEATGVGDGIPDIGVINAWLSSRSWAEDVQLRGPRKRFQDLSGDGTADDAVGGYHTWHVDVTSSSGVMFQENIDLSDGSIYEPDSPRDNHFGQGIGFSLEAGDRKHVGLSVFKDCIISDWANSGFYIYNSASGRAVLWNCTSSNTSAAAVRLGRNDEMIGGYINEHSPQGGFGGYGLRVEGGQNVRVVGVEINTSDDQTRSVSVDQNAEAVLLDRLAVEHSGQTYPIQFAASGAQVDFRNCDVYDTNAGTRRTGTFCGRSDVDATGWAQRSENNMTDVYNQSGGSLRVDGTVVGTGAYSATDLGLGDPTPLPNYYFDYVDSGDRDHARYFTVRDATTDEPIDAADVYVYQ